MMRIVLDADEQAPVKTLVWSVAFLPGMTIASADSKGRVQVCLAGVACASVPARAGVDKPCAQRPSAVHARMLSPWR